MNTLTDSRGLGLNGDFIYTDPTGRRGLVVFTGPEDGSEPFRPVLRSSDNGPLVHLAYLDADGNEPDFLHCEFAWIAPADLTVVGVLPSASTGSEDDDEESEEDCPHEHTAAASGEPYEQVCLDCDARLYLGAEGGPAFWLSASDDEAYYVTSLDGTATYDGPFDTWEAANERAEQIEADNHGLMPTDIQIKSR